MCPSGVQQTGQGDISLRCCHVLIKIKLKRLFCQQPQNWGRIEGKDVDLLYQTHPLKRLKELKKLMYDFIWDGKPKKIKRDILIMGYESGGLKMKDLDNFIKSLKYVG